MIKPLLSICIPTYNRCEYLGTCLDSIVSQREFLDGEVEVVVSDNASTDNTQTVVGKYTAKYAQVKYFRNDTNILDYNFPLVLSRATGLYRKLINDTFYVLNGELEYLCDLIKEHKDKHTQLFFLNQNRKSISQELIECNNFDQFAEVACTWTTWNGSFGLWDFECENIENDTAGCDLKLWVCKKVYELVYKKKSALVCNKRIFGYQPQIKPKDLTYGVFNVLYLNFFGILGEYIEKGALSEKTFSDVKKEDIYIILTDALIASEISPKAAVYSENENLKQLIFNEVKKNYSWKEYYSYYKRRKVATIVKIHLKKALEFLHIWDIIVALHIRDR